METYEIISAALTVLVIIFGGLYTRVRGVVKDFRDFLSLVLQVTEDNDISKIEWADLRQSFKDIWINFGSSKGRKKAVARAQNAKDNKDKRKDRADTLSKKV